MKKLIVLALMLTTGVACKKNTTTINDPIVGNWKLVLQTGGFGGIHQTADEWGHSRSYEFSTNGKYKITNDGNSSRGNYTVKDEYLTNYQQTLKTLHLDGSRMFIVRYVGDTMTFDMDVMDGITEWYVRE